METKEEKTEKGDGKREGQSYCMYIGREAVAKHTLYIHVRNKFELRVRGETNLNCRSAQIQL